MTAPESFAPLVVIPVYNHGAAIAQVVAGVATHDVPCLLVDDGSDAACKEVLQTLVSMYAGKVSLIHLPQNQGKGAAVCAGFRKAAQNGYTHVLQIDADGQHDTRDIPRFMTLGRAHPTDIICGCPVYDSSVPKARLYGRYATHVWVWINTLSFAIRDSMCGFRLYPLAPVMALLEREKTGLRMDFDTEVIVRLYWRGVDVVNLDVNVTYPNNGVSHFKVWRDNLQISWMHTRLFFGMLRRLPQLLMRRFA